MAVKKRKWCIGIIMGMFILSVLWIVWGNEALELNTYTITSEKIPEAFHGYRIVHVSDLHNTEFGDKNETLLKMLKDAEPDMIAITGDLIDSRRTDISIALQFAEEAMKIAPCYYVTGNHESRISEYEVLKNGLLELGVIVLEDEKFCIEEMEETITLCGVDDPSFQNGKWKGNSAERMKQKLKTLTEDTASYTILLSHRPEFFNLYVEYGLDLVLSGHAHGGQFRLPFIGGLFAPNQGWFPEYDAGLHTSADTNLIVSRGIGNSLFPFRINNRPEVILIELKTK